MVGTISDEYRPLFDALFEGVYTVDRSRRITYWNRAAERLTGFSSDEVVGHGCSQNILRHVDDCGTSLCREGCPLSATMEDGQPREARVFMHHKQGYRVPISVRCSALRNDDGEIVGGLEVFTDLSVDEALQRRVEELEKLAYLDQLTELANRRFAEASLSQRLDELRRYRWPFGVVMLDIDRFKTVNDTHGHPVGDRVLHMVAKTLALNARSFDLVCRWGGEEFLGIVRNVQPSRLEQVAERLRRLIGTAFLEIGDETVFVTASAGATVATKRDTAETLVERADRLLYASKAAGRDRTTTG